MLRFTGQRELWGISPALGRGLRLRWGRQELCVTQGLFGVVLALLLGSVYGCLRERKLELCSLLLWGCSPERKQTVPGEQW